MPDAPVIPPIRSPLMEKDGHEPGAQTASRDWWLFWNRLGGQANSNSRLVTQGTHAERPDASGMPPGALYVESDRGVIYYNRDGAWWYLAGTMWGTITPDQRPTDLGTNDGGFDFRGTDDAREFIWSQTAWIETTEVRYGTHAGRPNPLDVANGVLYVEFDRGSVIYQNQNNAWKYLAGTMFGTLSPDQRPTDLGVNDAGFDFRTSVPPAREFIWSQTAWVETTPVSGAMNLTHPNVVTKVDTVSGQIVEGGITDLSAANSDRVHITAAGNVGIGTPNAGAKLHVQDSVQASYLAHFCTDDGVPANAKLALLSLGLNASQRFAAICGAQTSSGNYAEGDFVVFTETGGGLVERLRLRNTGALVLPGMPSSNPGAGTKMLWYDPADGNRVKFAP